MANKLSKAADKQAAEIVVDPISARVLGIKGAALAGAKLAAKDDGQPYVALKYYDSGFECFSEWTAQELRQFTRFLNMLRGITWEQLNSHQGLRKKQVDPKNAQGGSRQRLQSVKDAVSGEISFFELRVDQGMRTHGFRIRDTFFLVLLDRGHRVFPG